MPHLSSADNFGGSIYHVCCSYKLTTSAPERKPKRRRLKPCQQVSDFNVSPHRVVILCGNSCRNQLGFTVECSEQPRASLSVFSKTNQKLSQTYLSCCDHERWWLHRETGTACDLVFCHKAFSLALFLFSFMMLMRLNSCDSRNILLRLRNTIHHNCSVSGTSC